MDENKAAVIHPVKIFKDALSAWSGNLIPIIAFYSINIFLAKILQLSSFACGLSGASPAAGGAGWINLSLTIFFGVAVLLVLVLNSFFCLMVIHYLKARPQGRPSFVSVFEEARNGIVPYVRALFLLLIFIFVVTLVGFLFYMAGSAFYGSGGVGARGFKMSVLLLTSTVFVVLFIAACWYGFFFSLAPLVAAFEKKRPLDSMRESRRRVKGNAMRYALAFLFYILTYVAVGLAAYFGLTRLTHDKFILDFLDPVMGTLFGPLWLAVWFISYQRLAELKAGIKQ